MEKKQDRVDELKPYVNSEAQLTLQQQEFARLLGRILAELWDREQRGNHQTHASCQ